MYQIIFFIFFYNYVFSQTDTDYELVNQVIADRVVKMDEVKLLSSQRINLIEPHLKELRFKKEKIFYQDKNSKESITLTEQEGLDIINAVQKSNNYFKWDEKKITTVEVLMSDDTRNYMKGNNKQNALLIISKPVFIKNGEIAVMFFSNFVYFKEYGFSDLCFYKKKNGIWKKWIKINNIMD